MSKTIEITVNNDESVNFLNNILWESHVGRLLKSAGIPLKTDFAFKGVRKGKLSIIEQDNNRTKFIWKSGE